MKRKTRIHLWSIIISIVGVITLLLFAVSLIIAMLVGSDEGCDSSIDTATISAGGISNGNWKDKNSAEYKAAKTIFETLTKKMGFSGAGAAGAVGNAIGESGLDVWKPNGVGYNGLFQWSQNQRLIAGGIIKSVDPSELTLDNEIKLMQYELNHGYTKVKTSVGKATDVHQATWNWFIDYEGMAGNENQYGQQRDPGAQWAYQEFGGSNISSNDSLLNGATATADTGVAQDQQNNACNTNGGDTASGKWGWPFKTIPKDGPTRYENGQQYGHTGMIRGGGNDFHDGYDFGSAIVGAGQSILAVHDGKVFKVANDVGWWYVWVKSSDGYNEVYQEAFNSRGDITVNEGDEIKVGDKIGTLSGSHLHLGITKKAITSSVQSGYSDDGTWLDPIKIIKEGINN